MTSRSVPKRHLSGLALFLALSDEAVSMLISALQRTSLTLNPDVALRASVKQLRSLSSGDAKSISDALLSLYMTLAASGGEATSDFVESIVVALEGAESEELKVSKENRGTLSERLIIVLNTEPLATSTRAVSLQFENLCTVSKFRVVSDIRPVFGESADDSPKAAIVIHTLNVHYYEGAEHKEFYVSMDTDDLQDLIDRLNRAQAKAEKLKAIIQTADVPLVSKN